MHQKITQEDVILYIYNELEIERRKTVEEAIATTPDLLVFFQESLLAINYLDSIQDEPTSTVINILNEESRSNSLEIH